MPASAAPMRRMPDWSERGSAAVDLGDLDAARLCFAEAVRADRGNEAAEQAAFDAVLATFSQHAEHWIGEVEGWAKAEQS